ncbi:hypothetical protein BGX30_010537 [Mortierella sp. GBA39]|nr:hypothetical protein BGX30_010537 [Mortierella sp. GBA39]
MDGAYVKKEPKDDGSITVLSSIPKKDRTKVKSRTEKAKRNGGAAASASGSDDTSDPDTHTAGSDSNDDSADSEDDDEGDSDVYEVERVVGHRFDQNNMLSYHIKWKGYPDEESSWEQVGSVFCLDMVKDYWKLYCDQGGSKTDPEGSIRRPTSSSLTLIGGRKTSSSTGSGKTKPSNSGSKGGKAGGGKGSSGGQSGRISPEPLLPDLSPLVKSSAAAAVATATTTATTTGTSATSSTSSKRARTTSPERQQSTPQTSRRSSNTLAVTNSTGSSKSTTLSTPTKLPQVKPETWRGATAATTASAAGAITTTTGEQQQQSRDTSLPRRLTAVGPVLITEENWTPPSHWNSWDDLVERVEAIETRSADKLDRSKMFVHLRWKSGSRMTLHPLHEIHDKAPRRLIDFYERHLQFQESD